MGMPARRCWYQGASSSGPPKAHYWSPQARRLRRQQVRRDEGVAPTAASALGAITQPVACKASSHGGGAVKTHPQTFHPGSIKPPWLQAAPEAIGPTRVAVDGAGHWIGPRLRRWLWVSLTNWLNSSARSPSGDSAQTARLRRHGPSASRAIDNAAPTRMLARVTGKARDGTGEPGASRQSLTEYRVCGLGPAPIPPLAPIKSRRAHRGQRAELGSRGYRAGQR